ncbi:MAG: hypothetical protein ACRBBS_09490 [Thalassovita sp.]
MIAGLRRMTDRILGRGSASVTVPVFDGVMKPNHLLDQAEEWVSLTSPGDMIAHEGALYVSDGPAVLRLTPDGTATKNEVLRVDGHITAIAPFAGGFAVAVDGTRVEVKGGAQDGQSWIEAEGAPFVAITALTVQGDALIATDASRVHGPDDWQRDLMEKQSGGRVLRLSPGGGAEVLTKGLGHAFGVIGTGDDLWISESWRHRVIGLNRATPVLDNMPGYPSRLCPAADGGYWLSVFACRTQLVEFVLRERDYREEMMRSMDPQFWVAPQVKPQSSFLEPLQGGTIKQMGVMKPWAPPRSYGLVLRLSAEGRALYSLHSRVDGFHHGITAVAEIGGALFCLSLGANAVLRLNLDKVGA